MEGGWIKLYRSIHEHWVFQDAEYFRAWCIVLMRVNHEPKKILIHNKIFQCERGQSFLSLRSWVDEFGVNQWSIKKVRTFFKLLENDGMIVTAGVHKTTRLTVCNYDTYQDLGQAKGMQRASKGQAKGKQRATTKEYNKNDKNDKNIKKGKIPPSLNEVMDYFQKNGFSAALAKRAFNYYNENEWRDRDGKPVLSWKSKMNAVWFKEENRNGATIKSIDQKKHDPLHVTKVAGYGRL